MAKPSNPFSYLFCTGYSCTLPPLRRIVKCGEQGKRKKRNFLKRDLLLKHLASSASTRNNAKQKNVQSLFSLILQSIQMLGYRILTKQTCSIIANLTFALLTLTNCKTLREVLGYIAKRDETTYLQKS